VSHCLSSLFSEARLVLRKIASEDARALRLVLHPAGRKLSGGEWWEFWIDAAPFRSRLLELDGWSMLGQMGSVRNLLALAGF